MKIIIAWAILALEFLIVSTSFATTPETVLVGHVGNLDDTTVPSDPRGAVSYSYRIGTTEVTNAQYAEFLNAVALTDVHSLFNTEMDITQTGGTGSFSYVANIGREQHPVTYVSFWDAARYANWLHNGQPTGAQGLSTTEDGAYYLNGVTNPENNTISRKADARWFIPSVDEWHKAAYHHNDGDTGNYFDYPTGSDTQPTAEAPPGGTNSSNYLSAGTFDTTPVGAYTAALSAYGTFDQGGNVEEWNEDILSATGRTTRGGSFLNSASAMSSSSFGSGHVVTNEIVFLGFRVATIPEPSALLLGTMGAAGLLLSRRQPR